MGESSSDSDDDVFEVDKIVGIKTARGGEMLYRVRWKNYSTTDDTWEPYENLTAGCDELIDEYLKTQPSPQRKKPPKRGQRGHKRQAAHQKSIVKDSDKDPVPSSPIESEKPAPPGEQFATASSATSVTITSPIVTLIDSNTSASDQVAAVIKKVELEVIVLSSSDSQESSNEDEDAISPLASTEEISDSPTRVLHQEEGTLSLDVTELKDNVEIKDTIGADSEIDGTPIVEDEDSIEVDKEVESLADTGKSPEPEAEILATPDPPPSPCDHSSELVMGCVQRYLATTEEMTVTDSDESKEIRNCVISIVGQLDDPDLTIKPFDLLMKLKSCLVKYKTEVRSLIAAIIVQSEDDFLDEKEQWISQVDKSLPGRWTPLHFAAALNKFKICGWLLRQGIWPDIQSEFKLETPLSLALQHTQTKHDPAGLKEFVKELIHHGANVTQKDFRDKVSYYSISNKNMAATSLLYFEHQRLKYATLTTLQSYLPTDYAVYMNYMFIEPQIVTVPPGIAYQIPFTFTPPSIPSVARLAFLVYERSEDSTEPPRKQNTVKIWPISSLKLNGVDISPADKKFLTVTLKSELKAGANSLEVITPSNFMDSILLVGYYITKIPSYLLNK